MFALGGNAQNRIKCKKKISSNDYAAALCCDIFNNNNKKYELFFLLLFLSVPMTMLPRASGGTSALGCRALVYVID